MNKVIYYKIKRRRQILQGFSNLIIPCCQSDKSGLLMKTRSGEQSFYVLFLQSRFQICFCQILEHYALRLR